MKHEWKRGMTVGTPDSLSERYSYCGNCAVEETDDNRDAACHVASQSAGIGLVCTCDPSRGEACSRCPPTLEEGCAGTLVGTPLGHGRSCPMAKPPDTRAAYSKPVCDCGLLPRDPFDPFRG